MSPLKKRGFGTAALVYFVTTATFMLVAIAACRAECNSPGFNTSGNFCNDCRYEGSIVVTRDRPCERAYRPNPSATHIDFLSHRIVRRAKHGIAGVNGTTFAYAPSKGYVGPDEFTVEVNYRQGNNAGKFLVHFTVAVQ
jgi:hypothetical protein